jgi:hypothetical protein
MNVFTRCLFFLMLFISVQAGAQDFMGYSMSNYAGITGAFLNPASTADSRFRFDAELIGADFHMSTNLLGLSKDAIKHSKDFKDTLFASKYLQEKINGDKKTFFSAQAFIFLPSWSGSIKTTALDLPAG